MTNTTSDEIINEDRLRNRVEDFYIENYKKGIFMGTKYEKITKEQFRLCREFSTNKKVTKIFKDVFEKDINSFNEFKKIFENLIKLSKDEEFWKNLEKILVKEEGTIDNIENVKNEFKKYYEVFSDKLSDVIYLKYYNYLSESEKVIKKEIKENIFKMFNNGNFTFEGIDRGPLKGRIQK